MGKFHRNDLSSRLSGLKQPITTITYSNNNNKKNNNKSRLSKRIDESRLSFKYNKPRPSIPSNDARLRLIQNQRHHQFDARRLLTTTTSRKNSSTLFNNKIDNDDYDEDNDDDDDDDDQYQLTRNRNRSNSRNRNRRTSKEPMIIVTGLGNVIRDGESSVRIVNNNKQKQQNGHHVITNGVDTFITLTNDLANKTKTKTNSSSATRDLMPITIRINNDKTNDLTQTKSITSSLEVAATTAHSNRQSNTSSALSTFYSSSSSSPQEMDHENSKVNSKSMFNRTGGSMYSNTIINNNKSSSSSNSSSSYLFNHTSDTSYQTNSASTLATSSKEGYKLLVSNLHPRVTEDDVLELFSDIGPIKRARFIDKGLAEVNYVRLEHAREAIQKYDQKELDGRTMVIGFENKIIAAEERNRKQQLQQQQNQVSPPIFSSNILPSVSLNTRNNYVENVTSMNTAKDTLSNKFKSIAGYKDTSSIQLPDSKRLDKNNSVAVDNSIIHQVLFNQKPSLNQNPVTFTVKL